MKDALIKLLKVKTILTLMLTVVFAYLSITCKISPSEFLTIFTMVVSFYFGTQSNKPNGSGDGTSE